MSKRVTASRPAEPEPLPALSEIQYRGLHRSTPIAPCVISIADLRRLYDELQPKAREALDRHLDSLPLPPHQTADEFNALKEHGRKLGTVTVAIEGMDGEQVMYSAPEALADATLPHRLKQITFDSAAVAKRNGVTPYNSFTLRLDFKEPPGFDEYNPWDAPTPNASQLEVAGTDSTWVTGVFESTLAFFAKRRRRREWLHTHGFFNLLFWFLGLPGALWVVYRLDSGVLATLPLHSALRGAIDIYVLLVALLVFRGIVYGFRWLFPVVELEGARTRTTRAVLGVVLSSLLLAFAYDVIKTLAT